MKWITQWYLCFETLGQTHLFFSLLYSTHLLFNSSLAVVEIQTTKIGIH